MAASVESGAPARGSGVGVMTPDAPPLVSLIVITHNHEAYVLDALASVSRQTLTDFEVVVIDDASCDRTVDHIRAWAERTSLRVTFLVNERNLGICASRNRALRSCRGQFITALSGDDYYEPDRLERQSSFFKTLDDSVAAVFGRARVISEVGTELGIWFEGLTEVPEGRIFDRLLRFNFIASPTVMIRRSAIDAVGGYDESLFYEDYDMWLRLTDRYQFRYLPVIVTNYRWLPSGVSRSSLYWGQMNESRVRILLKWYGRGSTSDDDVVIARAWRYALSAFAGDAEVGRTALRSVMAARPSLWLRVSLMMASLPGAHAVAAGLLSLLKRARARRLVFP